MEDTKEEIWKDIPGYEGRYKISNLGRVYSTPVINVAPSLRKISLNSMGYWSLSAYKNKKKTQILVHRALAICFIPNPHNKPQVNHIDGNRVNMNLSNLEWVTASENIIHGRETLERKHIILSKEDVFYILSYDRMYPVKVLSKEFNVCETTIYDTRRGHIHKKWRKEFLFKNGSIGCYRYSICKLLLLGMPINEISKIYNISKKAIYRTINKAHNIKGERRWTLS